MGTDFADKQLGLGGSSTKAIQKKEEPVSTSSSSKKKSSYSSSNKSTQSVNTLPEGIPTPPTPPSLYDPGQPLYGKQDAVLPPSTQQALENAPYSPIDVKVDNTVNEKYYKPSSGGGGSFPNQPSPKEYTVSDLLSETSAAQQDIQNQLDYIAKQKAEINPEGRYIIKDQYGQDAEVSGQYVIDNYLDSAEQDLRKAESNANKNWNQLLNLPAGTTATKTDEGYEFNIPDTSLDWTKGELSKIDEAYKINPLLGGVAEFGFGAVSSFAALGKPVAQFTMDKLGIETRDTHYVSAMDVVFEPIGWSPEGSTDILKERPLFSAGSLASEYLQGVGISKGVEASVKAGGKGIKFLTKGAANIVDDIPEATNILKIMKNSNVGSKVYSKVGENFLKWGLKDYKPIIQVGKHGGEQIFSRYSDDLIDTVKSGGTKTFEKTSGLTREFVSPEDYLKATDKLTNILKGEQKIQFPTSVDSGKAWDIYSKGKIKGLFSKRLEITDWATTSKLTSEGRDLFAPRLESFILENTDDAFDLTKMGKSSVQKYISKADDLVEFYDDTLDNIAYVTGEGNVFGFEKTMKTVTTKFDDSGRLVQAVEKSSRKMTVNQTQDFIDMLKGKAKRAASWEKNILAEHEEFNLYKADWRTRIKSFLKTDKGMMRLVNEPEVAGKLDVNFKVKSGAGMVKANPLGIINIPVNWSAKGISNIGWVGSLMNIDLKSDQGLENLMKQDFIRRTKTIQDIGVDFESLNVQDVDVDYVSRFDFDTVQSTEYDSVMKMDYEMKQDLVVIPKFETFAVKVPKFMEIETKIVKPMVPLVPIVDNKIKKKSLFDSSFKMEEIGKFRMADIPNPFDDKKKAKKGGIF